MHLAEEVVHLLEDGLLSEVQYELALPGQANGEALGLGLGKRFAHDL